MVATYIFSLLHCFSIKAGVLLALQNFFFCVQTCNYLFKFFLDRAETRVSPENTAIKRTPSSRCACKYSCLLRIVDWVCSGQISIVIVIKNKMKQIGTQLLKNQRATIYYSKYDRNTTRLKKDKCSNFIFKNLLFFFFTVINFSHMTLFEPPISLKTLSVFDLQT